MTLQKPTAILFDWDNTLVNTWPIIHRALNATLDHMQHPQWSFEMVKANVKHSMRDAFPDMFGARWEEAASHYQQSYRSINLSHLAPLPGTEIMLQWLRAQPLFIGVVSNKKGDTLRQELAHLGWQHYFDAVVGAGDAARDKPHADPAILALQSAPPAANNAVWFIGDTGVDLACAEAIGATPIFYGDLPVEGMTHDGHAFAAHVHDQAALLALLQQAIGVGLPVHAHG